MALQAVATLQATTNPAQAGPPVREEAKVKTASVSVTRPTSDPGESAAAREQARRCEEELDRETAIVACREALRLRLREPRRGALRQLLELRLAEAERFDDLVLAYREDTAELPQDAFAWGRLGSALLYFKDDAAGARAAFEEARKLRPEDPEILTSLGVCLNALAEHAAATAAFDEALRLEPEVLALRPAAKAAYEASRRGERWP
jgi:cytochrome c-type biogenesis protein CcmH/NrfG